MEKLFDINSEIVVYRNYQELDEKVKYYLQNESERVKIQNAGFERSKKDHTYFERAKKLIEIINEN